MNAPSLFFMIRDSGSVKFRCAFGFGRACLGGPLAGLGHALLVHRPATAVAVIVVAVIVVVVAAGLPVPFPPLRGGPGLLGGLGLQRRLRLAHLGQAGLPAGQLAGQVRLPPIRSEPGVLGLIDGLGVCEHALDPLAQRGHLGGHRGLLLA
jgi:hypothetical protein